MEKYGKRVTHSLNYYEALIRAILVSIDTNLTYKQTVDYLNTQGIPRHSGDLWDENSYKSMRKKLRHYEVYPNKTHQALLQLVYNGNLTVDETKVLFQRDSECM